MFSQRYQLDQMNLIHLTLGNMALRMLSYRINSTSVFFRFRPSLLLSLRYIDRYKKNVTSESTMASLQVTVWKQIKCKQQAATRFKERIVNR